MNFTHNSFKNTYNNCDSLHDFHFTIVHRTDQMDDKDCPVCKIRFSRKDVMMRHLRNKHETTQLYPRSVPAYSPQENNPSPPPPPPPQRYLDEYTTPQTTEETLLDITEKTQYQPKNQTNDKFVFAHPFTGILSGPTSCGKTFLVKRILQEHMIKPWPQRIIWIYRRWQPLYDEIKRTIWPPVEFIQGIPIDIDKDSYLNTATRNLIILDDVMASSSKDSRITELFTEGSHHRNLSVIAINQNLFFSKDPTQRRNCQYMILFNNPIDQQQIMTLARQMYPGKTSYFMDKFKDAVKRVYGYTCF